MRTENIIKNTNSIGSFDVTLNHLKLFVKAPFKISVLQSFYLFPVEINF